MTPQGTSMVLYCFARAGYRPRPALLVSLLQRLQLGEDCSTILDLAGGDPTDSVMEGDGEDMEREDLRGVRGRQHLSSGEVDSASADPGSSLTVRGVGGAGGDVSAQTAAVLLWSMGKLGFRPPDSWIRSLLVHTVHLLPRAQPRELCNLAKVRN